MQINLTDKSFKAEHAVQYELSLQADRDLLSYCIYDPEKKQHIVLRNYKGRDVHLLEDLMNHLEGIFMEDELLDLPFRKVRFIYYSQLSTLIPDQYFNRQYLTEYYRRKPFRFAQEFSLLYRVFRLS